MKKWFVFLVLVAPVIAWAQLSNQLVNSEGATGLGLIESVTGIVQGHADVSVSVGLVIMDVLMRLWPSNKVRSLLSYAGKLLGLLATLLFTLSDILSKIVPDRRPPPELK